MRFKKKTIYIVGIVLFTLILLADLVIYFAVPANVGRDNIPNMGGSFDAESFEGMMGDDFDPESFGAGKPDNEDFDFGSFAGEMPDRGSDSAMPNRPDDSNMMEEFESTNRPDRGQMGTAGNNGFLSGIRSWFWPILIICILGDSLCVFMLVRISRKNGKQEDEPEEDNDDSRSKRDNTNTWLAVTAVILVGAVAVTSLPSGRSASTMEANTSVEQAEAAVTDIASIYSGSGTLLSSDADIMELPETVKITSYTVKNSDHVQAGDVIAYVDKTSVLKAIYEVQSLISQMDAEIAEVQSDTLENKITARADGRVKAIYASEGDSVSAAMYEHEALILISLGGSMTVEIESGETVSVGQSLTVTLSDDSQIEGKVQQVRNGKITVTTTDDGPAPDDTVSVTTGDGILLGTGTLCISSPLKVSGYWGSVSQIQVTLNQKVSAGQTLLTLTDTQDTARYQMLLTERQELSELVNRLNQIYQDGKITAQQGGIIAQIPEDAVYAEKIPSSASAPSGNGASIPSDGAQMVLPEAAEQEEGVFAGVVTNVSYGVLQIKISETDMTGSSIDMLENMDDALFTVERQYSPAVTVAVNCYRDGQSVQSSVNAIQAGDKVLLTIAGGDIVQIDYIPGTAANTMQQMPSAGGFGNQQSVAEQDQEEAVYEVEMCTVCAIIPAETMTIDISVDELDILTLTVGQEAAITLDALPGQSFAGAVQKINPVGVNEGGSTKYTVTMEVPRTEQMLDGMNASVRIEVSRLNSVLTIPAEAVYEEGNRTYVYTAVDTKSGEPANPVGITTGASDGTNIQILSGLESGDVVYYSYADSIVYRFAS